MQRCRLPRTARASAAGGLQSAAGQAQTQRHPGLAPPGRPGPGKHGRGGRGVFFRCASCVPASTGRQQRLGSLCSVRHCLPMPVDSIAGAPLQGQERTSRAGAGFPGPQTSRKRGRCSSCAPCANLRGSVWVGPRCHNGAECDRASAAQCPGATVRLAWMKRCNNGCSCSTVGGPIDHEPPTDAPATVTAVASSTTVVVAEHGLQLPRWGRLGGVRSRWRRRPTAPPAPLPASAAPSAPAAHSVAGLAPVAGALPGC